MRELVTISFLTVIALVDAAAWPGKLHRRAPTSWMTGKAFDRIAIIWLENTDYDKAIGDRACFVCPHSSTMSADPLAANLAWLASKGVTLDNYHAVTHPSQPNYLAAIGGDYFGMKSVLVCKRLSCSIR